jgi:hypothetical protein
LKRRRLFISLGHDEYWTKGERDAVEAARDAGTNVAFIGGNEAYWQARLDASTSGMEARTITEYKDAALDPLARSDPASATDIFAGTTVRRPESTLSGLGYGTNATPDYQPWRPASTDAWVFRDTGIRDDDAFPGIVGYEYDHMAPAADGAPEVTVVGRSPVNGFLGADTAISALYVASSGATVFNAGTVAWPWGLDDYGHEAQGRFADDRLRKMTANIIERLSAPRTARQGS